MTTSLSDTQRTALLDGFQRDFPLVSCPFAEIGRRVGLSEEDVLEAFRLFSDEGIVSRIGPVFTPHRSGWSTLAALSAPEADLVAIADLVSSYEEVNHNYEREHRLNLWFVITAPTRERVDQVMADIEYRTGLAVMDLPMVEAFRLDLGFPLQAKQ